MACRATLVWLISARRRLAAQSRWLMNPLDAPAQRSRLIWIAVWAVLAAGLAYAASSLSWGEVLAVALRADPRWLVLALVANLANAPLWALCWRCLMGRKARAPLGSLTRILAVVVAAIQAFSILGGGATAFVLITGRLGLSRPAAASLLVLEGLTTGIVKVLLVGAALAIVPGATMLRSIGAGLLGMMAVGLVGLIIVSRSGNLLDSFAARIGGRPRIWIERVADWTSHLEAVRSPARLGGAVFFMLLRRIADGLAAWCVGIACGVPVGPEIILLVIASIAIATMIPSPPGAIGVYELAVVAAYQWVGIPAEIALAAALLQHAISLTAALAPAALIVGCDLSLWRRKTPP